MWELQYVPFDGIPFMVVGRRVYSCHQGVDKHKHEKQTRQLQLVCQQTGSVRHMHFGSGYSYVEHQK